MLPSVRLRTASVRIPWRGSWLQLGQSPESTSAEGGRASQWAELAFGSLVQACDRLQHDCLLGSFAEVTLDEVVEEVRELLSQIKVTQHHAQVFGCPTARRPLLCLGPSF